LRERDKQEVSRNHAARVAGEPCRMLWENSPKGLASPGIVLTFARKGS
jgi:hypothetical protein